MITLFNIGLGLLLLAVRLSMVAYSIRRTESIPVPSTNDLISRGKFIILIGLIVASLGMVRFSTNSSEGYEMIKNGLLVMAILGLSWWIQGAGNFKTVYIGTLATMGLGLACLISYLCLVYWI